MSQTIHGAQKNVTIDAGTIRTIICRIDFLRQVFAPSTSPLAKWPENVGNSTVPKATPTTPSGRSMSRSA